MYRTTDQDHQASRSGRWSLVGLGVGVGLACLTLVAACPLTRSGNLVKLRVPHCDKQVRGACVQLTARTGFLQVPNLTNPDLGAKSVLAGTVWMPFPLLGNTLDVIYLPTRNSDTLVAQIYATPDGTCSQNAVASGTLLASYSWDDKFSVPDGGLYDGSLGVAR